MISAWISDDFIDSDGVRTERRVCLETENDYNPDILQDLSRRCVELWAMQHDYVKKASADD